MRLALILLVLALAGCPQPPQECPAPIPGDLNGDGEPCSIQDFAAYLAVCDPGSVPE